MFDIKLTIDGINYHFGEDGVGIRIDGVVPDTKKYNVLIGTAVKIPQL